MRRPPDFEMVLVALAVDARVLMVVVVVVGGWQPGAEVRIEDGHSLVACGRTGFDRIQ